MAVTSADGHNGSREIEILLACVVPQVLFVPLSDEQGLAEEREDSWVQVVSSNLQMMIIVKVKLLWCTLRFGDGGRSGELHVRCAVATASRVHRKSA